MSRVKRILESGLILSLITSDSEVGNLLAEEDFKVHPTFLCRTKSEGAL